MFVPASTTKLASTYMTLNYLGASYVFKTQFFSNATVSNKKLNGDLVIKFVGDPTLTLENLKFAMSELGISKISGNVIVDNSMFDSNRTSPGGFTWDNKVFYYAAPKSSVIVDKNCAKAQMMPAKVDAKAALLIENPEVLRIENTVDTVSAIHGVCPYRSKYLGQNKYLVYGCMPILVLLLLSLILLCKIMS